MLLLFHPVIIILFAVTVTATPPPGYVHRPNDDKSPPNYQYKYEIADVDGKESQGKVETRSGELASGRYYVNDEQSSTDVKYFADEWGYHPLVKYRASNDHSAATAHFALGEHVVKTLLNGSEVGDEVKLSGEKRQNNYDHRQQLHRRRRPIQLIQPYTPVSSGHDARASASSGLLESQQIDDHELSSSSTTSPVNLLLNYDLQRTVSRGSEFHEASTTSSSTVSGFQQNFHNYVTLPRLSTNDRQHQRQSIVQEAHSSAFSSSTPDYRSFSDEANIYATNPSTSEPFRSAVQVDALEENHETRQESSNLFSIDSDDLLVVQNAGSFGRRLNPASSNSLGNTIEYVTPRFSTSRPISSTSVRGTSSHSSYSTTTPRTTISYPTEFDDRRSYSTTPIPDFQDVANSVSAETLSNEYKNSIHHDSSVSGAYAGIFAKIFPNSGVQGVKLGGENTNSLSTENSQLIRNENSSKNDSLAKGDRLTTPGLSAYGKRRDHELYVTLRQSLDSEIRGLSHGYSSTPQTLSTFNSKPIIVAELSNYNKDKGFEYSTTFPCTDESYESSTIVPNIPRTGESLIDSSDTRLSAIKQEEGRSHITTSSVILNPIQAGVSLVNAGATELIASSDQTNKSPAPVNEPIDDEQVDQAIKHFSANRINGLEKIVSDHTRGELYENTNSAFGQTSSLNVADIGESIPNVDAVGDLHSDVGSASQDQQIEIQKSVEIYQNAPVHEIHYPPEVISQVSSINHLGQQQQHQENSGGAVYQQEEPSRSYAELRDVENAKQFQQDYNSAQDQQRQSINTQISFENSRGAQGMESVYLGNLVRVNNDLVDYATQQQSQTLNAGHEHHVKIIKMIRDNIPEVKYKSAKTPQINVQVYPSAVANSGNNDQSIKTEQDIASLHEQQVKATQAVAEGQAKKVQSQLQRILSESGTVQRYFSGAGWTRYQEQQERQQEDEQSRTQGYSNVEIQQSQSSAQNYPKSYDSRVTQYNQQQSVILPYDQYNFSQEKNPQQNLGTAAEEFQNSHKSTQVSYLPPPVAERIVQKTIHVPQPYPVEVSKIIEKTIPYPVEKIVERKVPYPVEKIVERKVPYPVEKIVERKVPYPVEKIVERKVPIPQPFPVPVQVPVDRIIEKQVLQPYPVHIEKIIEKKVPYAVQRLVPQPYPIHILQPYPVEKIIEKPVHIPITVEKIVEKKVHVPHPYPVQVPIKVPYPVELTKYIEQSVQVPYGVRYGVSYQQIMKPQSSQGLYGHQGSASVPVYGLSFVSNHHRDRLNESKDFRGYSYNKPAIAFISGRGDSSQQSITNGWEQFASGRSPGSPPDHHQAFAKKSYAGQSSKPSLTYSYSGLSWRQASYKQNNVVGGDKVVSKDEYVGPVPAAQQQQSHSNPHQKGRSRSLSDQQQQLQLQSVQQHSTAVTRTAPLSTSTSLSRRAARQQQENPPHYQSGPGAFRQSKIEYGFKPPMVPSVQYDEKTATKVEN